MKKLMIAAFVAAQTLPVQTALAAELPATTETRAGAFGGLRVRVGLDGATREPRVRAGLALTPTLHSRSSAGESRLQFGEGVELGLFDRGPLRLSVAGHDVRRLAAAQDEEERDRGPSTLGWIAIGVGVVAVIVVGAAAICFSDSDCIPSE